MRTAESFYIRPFVDSQTDLNLAASTIKRLRDTQSVHQPIQRLRDSERRIPVKGKVTRRLFPACQLRGLTRRD